MFSSWVLLGATGSQSYLDLLRSHFRAVPEGGKRIHWLRISQWSRVVPGGMNSLAFPGCARVIPSSSLRASHPAAPGQRAARLVSARGESSEPSHGPCCCPGPRVDLIQPLFLPPSILDSFTLSHGLL